MKKKAIFSGMLALALYLAFPYTADAQLGKVARFVGKTIATEALSTIVQHEVERAFYPSDNAGSTNRYANYSRSNYSYPIEVTVVNNLGVATYFWVTTDGNYWYPRILYPGQYFYVRSGNHGVVGVFNGYKVDVLRQGGKYYSSQFF